mgnify:CR=1 FL=1
METRKPVAIRATPATFALFDQVVQALNAQLPHGRISKAEAFEMVVSSAAATLAAGGQLANSKRGRGDDQAA